jgi:hypothetical protein
LHAARARLLIAGAGRSDKSSNFFLASTVSLFPDEKEPLLSVEAPGLVDAEADEERAGISVGGYEFSMMAPYNNCKSMYALPPDSTLAIDPYLPSSTILEQPEASPIPASFLSVLSLL